MPRGSLFVDKRFADARPDGLSADQPAQSSVRRPDQAEKPDVAYGDAEHGPMSEVVE